MFKLPMLIIHAIGTFICLSTYILRGIYFICWEWQNSCFKLNINNLDNVLYSIGKNAYTYVTTDFSNVSSLFTCFHMDALIYLTIIILDEFLMFSDFFFETNSKNEIKIGLTSTKTWGRNMICMSVFFI